MTDLERKLAETLREQGGEVTPDLAGAWAEQLRRQRRPRAARRRLTVLVAPLAAVLVVLTSVLLATQLNTPSDPIQPALPGESFSLAPPEYRDLIGLLVTGTPVALTNFAGQTDRWTAYAFSSTPDGLKDKFEFCVAAVPQGSPVERSTPQYGTKGSACMPLAAISTVCAGYVGEFGGPLPVGKAVYLIKTTVQEVRLYDAEGDLSIGRAVGDAGPGRVFVADVKPGSPPVRFEVSSKEARPASR